MTNINLKLNDSENKDNGIIHFRLNLIAAKAFISPR